jgi:hypothetical protein
MRANARSRAEDFAARTVFGRSLNDRFEVEVVWRGRHRLPHADATVCRARRVKSAAAVTSIEIPDAQLAIHAVAPNPVRGDLLSLTASLASVAPAKVRVLDLAGRAVREESVPGNLSGPIIVSLAGGARLRPGIYLVELRQASQRSVARFVYLR